MIAITPHMRILLAVEPADFRKGIDGLARLCRMVLKSDPFSGAVFVFRNKKATALKILIYDGQGFWLCQKRLSKGRFGWWPCNADAALSPLDAHQLQLLLWNGDPSSAAVAPHWKKLTPGGKKGLRSKSDFGM
jgi:transposase